MTSKWIRLSFSKDMAERMHRTRNFFERLERQPVADIYVIRVAIVSFYEYLDLVAKSCGVFGFNGAFDVPIPFDKIAKTIYQKKFETWCVEIDDEGLLSACDEVIRMAGCKDTSDAVLWAVAYLSSLVDFLDDDMELLTSRIVEGVDGVLSINYLELPCFESYRPRLVH